LSGGLGSEARNSSGEIGTMPHPWRALHGLPRNFGESSNSREDESNGNSRFKKGVQTWWCMVAHLLMFALPSLQRDLRSNRGQIVWVFCSGFFLCLMGSCMYVLNPRLQSLFDPWIFWVRVFSNEPRV
jgi:hypothetical protein